MAIEVEAHNKHCQWHTGGPPSGFYDSFFPRKELSTGFDFNSTKIHSANGQGCGRESVWNLIKGLTDSGLYLFIVVVVVIRHVVLQ